MTVCFDARFLLLCLFPQREEVGGMREKEKDFYIFVFLSSYVLFSVTDSGESEITFHCLLKVLYMIALE